MDSALIIILIVIANLALYWLFFGKSKFAGKAGLLEAASEKDYAPSSLPGLKQKNRGRL